MSKSKEGEKISDENLDNVLELIGRGFEYITNNNLRQMNAPQPMTITEIGRKFGIPVEDENDPKTALRIIRKLKEEIDPNTKEGELIYASFLYRTKGMINKIKAQRHS